MTETPTIPWVSFCMSTFQRPQFLQTQLETIARQTFRNFEVIISDNDPAQSAAPIVAGMGDGRFKYFSNGTNLGMVASFNKSIERANGTFIVMITDDDPVQEDFLKEMYDLYCSNPNLSLYAGFLRSGLAQGEVELIAGESFIKEILDLNKTSWLLWSSCIMRKSEVDAVGKMPDYGSPHFADHALIAMVGSRAGALVKNNMYSSLSSHEDNFSKSNFDTYVVGCRAFYQLMQGFSKGRKYEKEELEVVVDHLGKWFFGCIFTLKKHFYIRSNTAQHNAIVTCAKQILELPYMHRFKPKYIAKSAIFEVKKRVLFKKMPSS